MNISSPPRRRLYVLSVIAALIGFLLIGLILLIAREYGAGEITGLFFGGLFAFFFAPAILLKAKRIDVDREGVTITRVLTGRSIRYLHSEMTGVDYWLNQRIETSSMVRYIHVIEFIPTGEPIIRITTDSHANFDAMLAQVITVYGSKARNVSGTQPEGF